jgi:hypothetical protein
VKKRTTRLSILGSLERRPSERKGHAPSDTSVGMDKKQVLS